MRASTRRELVAVLAIAWCLVLARSLVYVLFEQSFFDSDQAITGLMAKHLSEGRAFPLFFYGQSFLLGVEAWLAAPLFWAAGPSVATLHASLVLTNLASVTLLIVGLTTGGQLRPVYALAASAFFALAPPLAAGLLVQANGANIEPFLFLLLLWFVRERPLWFGCVLGVGFLTREFTIYAVPVLLVAQAFDGRLLRAATVRNWLLVAVTFAVVVASVDALKPFADSRGPGTRGPLLPAAALSEVDNLSQRSQLSAGELPSRALAMAVDHLPRLLGAPDRGDARAQVRNWMSWLLVAALAGAMVRTLVLSWRARTLPSSPFGWYVLGVGVMAAAGYIVTRPLAQDTARYYLLVLLVPVGATAIYLANEPRAWFRRGGVAIVCAWAVLAGVDHGRQFVYYRSGGEPDQARAIADALVARHVHVAQAGYWRAYKLTFLTSERVKVASTDFARIDEYQDLAAAEGDKILTIADGPCPGGEPVATAYLCREP